MNRKLFAFDIDGTLLDSQKKPLNSTKEAIRKLQELGHFVTIASGRSRYFAAEVISELGIPNYIILNGAAAFVDHEQVYKNVLDNDALHRLVTTMDEKKVDTAMLTVDEVFRTSSNDLETMGEAMHSFNADVPAYDKSFLQEEDSEVYQSLAFYSSDLDDEVNEEFPEFRFVRWHEQSVDVLPQNGSKAETLMFMAKRLGIQRSDVIAFGDGNNDIEMLEASGIGVAMGNASETVKQSADIITSSNDEDGIWNALKDLALI